ncbi:hypothetical protein KFK09_006949 [Dendrobium nobile]|uniref:Uncharacterized protein n=1 Tax=Dendrobium nobile TaxID=94219 RepID=A0A8T3BSQ3_DENNO|nr:hypothetical protein KFK09_006949 [Dendrobium nobile]
MKACPEKVVLGIKNQSMENTEAAIGEVRKMTGEAKTSVINAKYGPWIHVQFKNRWVFKGGDGYRNNNSSKINLNDNVADCLGEQEDSVKMSNKEKEGMNNDAVNYVIPRARKKEAALYLKEMVKDHEIFFIGLMETKMSNINRKDVDVLVDTSSQVIVGDLSIPRMGIWWIATVYGNRCCKERETLWSLLDKCMVSSNPSIIGGDFNCVLNKEEKRGGKRHLARVASIHSFIAFKVNDKERVKSKIIRFEDTWRMYPAARSIVYHSWMKNDLSKCKDLNELKEKMKMDIMELQVKEAMDNDWSAQDLILLRSKIHELNVTLKRLSTWWNQRAKARWLEEGDYNSKLFHNFATARRNGNRVNQIIDVYNVMQIEEEDIEKVFIQHFESKWRSRDCQLTGWPDLLAHQKLNDEGIHALSSEFSVMELKQLVFQQGNNRSPGMDVLTSSFYKYYWDIVWKDLWNAINSFLTNGCMRKDWKDTLIISITKVKNPLLPSNYRPISLCQTNYKVVATMLVNRLKMCMPKLITEEQMAFILGRAISEHCLLAQEIFHKFKVSRNRKHTTVWDGLLLIRSSNGMASLLVMLILLWNALLMGLNIGIQISSRGPRITHLLYADDVVIFSHVSKEIAKEVKGIVDDFCNWTGQTVNANKSQIIFSNSVNNPMRKKIAKVLGFKVVKEMSYLGIKLTHNRLRAADFHDILINMMDRLNTWGKNFLSMGEVLFGIKLMEATVFTTLLGIIFANQEVWEMYNQWPIFADCAALEGVCVQQLMLENGQWNIVLLQEMFHPKMVMMISLIQVNFCRDDLLEMQKFCPGRTVSALAFEQVLKGRFSLDDDDYCNWLNKLKLSKKVETFWWRLGKSAIPTNLYLNNRKLMDNDSFARGCHMVKNYEHIIVQCKYLIDIIKQIVGWGISITIFHSLDHCFKELKRILAKHLGIVQIYCTIIYFSWKNRNQVKHGKTELPSYVVDSNALLVAITKTSPSLSNWSTNLLRESQISWCPPLKEWMKINVDASLTSSGLAGICGMFRDCNGRFIIAFGKKMIHWDIAQLEMGAILSVKDYVKSWMQDYKGVIVESDNINVITYIKNSLKQNNGIMDFKSVRDSLFVNDFNKVVFLHAYRKCNKVANLCATMDLENSFYFDSFSFDDIPPLMVKLIKEEYPPFEVCN